MVTAEDGAPLVAMAGAAGWRLRYGIDGSLHSFASFPGYNPDDFQVFDTDEDCSTYFHWKSDGIGYDSVRRNSTSTALRCGRVLSHFSIRQWMETRCSRLLRQWGWSARSRF
jgi:hypothetical protein